MPTTPPVQDSLAIVVPRLVVLVGELDGSTPTVDNDAKHLIPLTCSISSTGRRDDVLTFGYLSQPRLVDTSFPLGMETQIELRAIDEEGEPSIVIGWGMMVRQPQRIDDNSEMVTIECRIGDQHFGAKITQYPIWAFDTESGEGSEVWIQRPLIFNPEIDGQIRPNMSWYQDETDGFYYVQDWESSWTNNAILQQGGNPSMWDLKNVVLALCWWANPAQTFIQNPTMDDLDGASAFAGVTPQIANLAIPFGASLPDALDAVLVPLEMSWYLSHSSDGDSGRQTKIVFFRRGDGPTKSVYLQPPKSIRDVTKTNILSWDAHYSVIDLANRIECYGDFEKVESTFQLYLGWNNDYDATTLDKLAIGQPLYNTNPEIGRRFVLNEAGDYNDMRPEITVPYDFAADGLEFTQNLTVRRRRFFRCLSQHTDGDEDISNGYRVDWYDWNQFGAVFPVFKNDPGWVRAKWPFTVLEKECGIMFDGNTPPEPLWRLISAGNANSVHVRITATVCGDKRVSGVANATGKSANGMDMTLVLNVADKFQRSIVSTHSIFTGSPSEARDDTAAILTYAQNVQTIEDVLRLDCSIHLEGALHPEFSIGDTIPKVDGRNLSMQLTAAGRAPQIVGFNMDFQKQSCELLLETFKKERPHVVHDGGKARVIQAGMQPRPALKNVLITQRPTSFAGGDADGAGGDFREDVRPIPNGQPQGFINSENGPQIGAAMSPDLPDDSDGDGVENNTGTDNGYQYHADDYPWIAPPGETPEERQKRIEEKHWMTGGRPKQIPDHILKRFPQ